HSGDAEGAGHGGMDWFVINGFIEACKRGEQTPIDVYDSVTWSAIIELSEQSIAKGNMPMEFPDFTGGQWVWRKNTFALDDTY
ncbi:MAG: gfo/Idh/MocA family oxidoreductase, partial [Flavobacteriales bacterium]|nr:gfo/Idh/MocA family oxidoreductase [Flavobacteriales bacterium]